MRQARHRLAFATQTGEIVRLQKLSLEEGESAVPSEGRVVDQVDDLLGALTKEPLHHVTPRTERLRFARWNASRLVLAAKLAVRPSAASQLYGSLASPAPESAYCNRGSMAVLSYTTSRTSIIWLSVVVGSAPRPRAETKRRIVSGQKVWHPRQDSNLRPAADRALINVQICHLDALHFPSHALRPRLFNVRRQTHDGTFLHYVIQILSPVMQPAFERAPGDARELAGDFRVAAARHDVDDALLYAGREAARFDRDGGRISCDTIAPHDSGGSSHYATPSTVLGSCDCMRRPGRVRGIRFSAAPDCAPYARPYGRRPDKNCD